MFQKVEHSAPCQKHTPPPPVKLVYHSWLQVCFFTWIWVWQAPGIETVACSTASHVGTALGVGPPDDDLSGHPIGLRVGCVGGFSVSSLLLFVIWWLMMMMPLMEMPIFVVLEMLQREDL